MESDTALNELSKAIESLTMSGSQGLDEKQLKLVKLMCKKSLENVDRTFRMVWSQLSKNHSQVRISTLAVINEIFTRSHSFREMVIDRIHELFDLTLDINKQLKLPKPKKYHNELKAKAIGFIDDWNKQFGPGYPQLLAGFNYLKDKKLVDFNQRRVFSEAEIKRLEEERNKKQKMLKLRVEKAIEEYNQVEINILELIKQINSCFDLLLPKFDVDEENKFDDRNLERVQLSRNDFQITLKPFVEVSEDEDTEAIIENLTGMVKELSSVTTAQLKPLLVIFSKGSDLCPDNLKKAIDLKHQIHCIKEKFNEIKIIKSRKANDSDSESDDDFEEVPMAEDLDILVPQHLREQLGLEPVASTSTSMLTTSANSTDSVPSSSDNHRCNARLPSGKLCPRKDKVRCPFHGKIIPRDLLGVPVNEEDRRREEAERAKRVPDWQDPVLLREIKAATGLDLEVKKSTRKGKRKYPGLEDPRKADDSARKRLKRVVFNKDRLRRVNDELDFIDETKCQNSFGNQWNYALQS